ncbi:hypothetical protein AVEN_28927-1 [Araneus ventricosus]|uniref:Reverse transcriptase domain-containing protein n=1 Tax=Araneus ventricosus TaxID=182803 RepID=A0A4Y2AJ07_ARAVE|nr:hypothetical protein AVEN_28927-1 [Araneus ventricosus]
MSKPIMRNLEESAGSYKSSFNKGKTKHLMFKFRKEITNFPSIRLYGSRITYDKDIRYLGIKPNSSPSFIPHLNKVNDLRSTKRIKITICKITEKARRIARATWGLRPEVVKVIYSVVIEEIIMYGNEIWYKGTVKQKNKLLEMQRMPMIAITK